MRMTVFAFCLILSIAGTAAAQEWDLYVSARDGFKVDFPGQPKVTETTWKSQLDYTLPARVYSVDKGRERYSLTVVDYSGIEQQGIERAKSCPPGNQQCRKTPAPSSARDTGSRMSAARLCMRPSSCSSAMQK